MKCAHCGAEFEPNKYHQKTQKYCSRKCRLTSQDKTYRETHRAEINEHKRKRYREDPEYRERVLFLHKRSRWRKAGE